MCGIFAVFNSASHQPAQDDDSLVRATRLAAHRGPDNQGFFRDKNCFLGHARLSIIDLDERANQPFFFENLAIVFNGEIFNYIELGEELRQCGYVFDTTSDTEVVLKAFHYWGVNCFAKFNGMWSMAIYDRGKQDMTVSRDRFGQKPLFITRDGDTVYVASEVQQLVPFSRQGADYKLIQMFLKEGTYEGKGRTFFRGIEVFPKAHYCVISTDGNIESTRYWDYWSGDITDADDASLHDFDTLLQDAVNLRLRADVPFSVLLSGGLDSTVVATYASQYNTCGQTIPAFTYASRDAEDESAYAQTVADRLGLKLTIKEQEQNPVDYRNRLKQLVRHLGRGHSSPAIVSVDYLYESVAANGMRIALDGQGADELLAGYKNYHPLVVPMFLLKGQFRQAFASFRDQLAFGFARSWILFLRNRMPPIVKKTMRLIYGYERLFRNYQEEERHRPLVPIVPMKPNQNALNRYLIWHHELGLEHLLYYGDIIAMRHGVENRSPFMDHRLVDFVFQRSERLKIWNGIDKYVLRCLPLYKGLSDVLDRPKIGFSSDIKPTTKREMLEELRESPILEWPVFSDMFRKVVQGELLLTAKYERLFFRIFQAHLWSEEFHNDAVTVQELRIGAKGSPGESVQVGGGNS